MYKPRPDCETCNGSGKIQKVYYTDENDPSHFSIDIEYCPECEEISDIENEQINTPPPTKH